MKIKDLIRELSQGDPNARVFIDNEDGLPCDFNGVSFDDLGDVKLNVLFGDEAVWKGDK